jgi:FkbM family methyltransferase
MIICGDEMLAMQYIPKGGTMLDIGSCYGMWIDNMLPRADKIYAFEPDVRLFPRLLERFKGNLKVSLYNIAIHNKCGANKYQINDEGNSRLEAQSGEDVLTATIDSIFEYVPISCIKIDIEGREVEALEGGIKTIMRYLPVLIIEAHDNRKEIKEFLFRNSYITIFSNTRSRFPLTDNGLMVAIHSSKIGNIELNDDASIITKRFSGDIAVSILGSKNENTSC